MSEMETYQPVMESATILQPTAEAVDSQQGKLRRVASALAGVTMTTATILGATQIAEAINQSDETHAAGFDTAEQRVQKMRKCPIIIGHRGSVGRMHKPGKNFTTENTVWATRRAQLYGADGSEFDVRDSAEHTSWLMHDGTVDRTTDGHGAVRNMSDARMERLHTPDGSGVPKYEDGEYLRDIFATSWANTRNRPMRLKANILNWRLQADTKAVSNLPQYVSITHEIVREKQGVDPSKVIMWATDKTRDAQRIHDIDPDAEIGRIFYTGRPTAQMLRTSARANEPFTSFNVHEAQIERRWVHTARQHGMDVLARTVNDVRTAERVIKAGVTFIVTDNVPVVNAWNLERRGICRAVRKNMPVITPPEPTPTPTPTETTTPSPTETPTSSDTVSSTPSVATTPLETTLSSSIPISTTTATP